MAKIVEICKQIDLLRAQLKDKDYIACKLAEAIAEYIVLDTGDKSKLIAIYNEYQETIKNKESWRDEINALEEELKTIKGE